MKLLYLFVLLSTITFSLNAQNAGTVINDPNAELRAVAGFHTIMIEDGIDLYLTQSESESVAVSAIKAEHRSKIVTKVVDGVLKIYFNENGVVISWRDRKLRAYVSINEIQGIKAFGGSDVIIKGVLQAKKLQIQVSGGSDLVGGVEVSEELNIEGTGGSDLRLKGTANNMKVKVTGGSDFEGIDLKAEYVIIEATGGSDANVWVQKEMFAEARGGSDIHYKGDPTIKHKSATGGGSIHKKN